VLTVVGRGATFASAIETAYRAVERVRFDGMQFRRDIGRKAMASGK
jgi:phosphoribosylamine--glycine ligase